MMLVGTVVVSLCGLAYRRTADRSRLRTVGATLLPLLLLAVPVALAPANPVHGPVPAPLAAAYRWSVVVGQGLLWATIAAVHTWLGTPELTTEPADFPAPSD